MPPIKTAWLLVKAVSVAPVCGWAWVTAAIMVAEKVVATVNVLANMLVDAVAA